MAKLWQKTYDLDATIERFTVGEDVQLDLRLAEFDVLGSIAHAKMLNKIGILSDDELRKLHIELVRIYADIEHGHFIVKQEQEDVHTAIEEEITAKLGDAGKKLHTARSRNDQSALDCRLYARDRLTRLRRGTLQLAGSFMHFADLYRSIPMVGRTHTQRAMPSSVGLWGAAFAEAMLENAELLRATYRLVNRSPLGSAASYGVALPIDREMTSELLGFERPIINVLYANNTRGKVEAEVLGACALLMSDLAKAAGDIILFSIPEIGYFLLPERFCGGSSIMPQKKNPGALELIRARASTVLGHYVACMGVIKALPSGYNRDLQETKGPLIHGLTLTQDCTTVLDMFVRETKVDEKRCIDAFSPEVYAADKALEMSFKEGIPFREAYKQVGLNLDKLKSEDPARNISTKSHLGAPGNLALDRLAKLLDEERKSLDADAARVEKAEKELTAL